NTVVYVSVVLSPWLLPPVAMQDFPVTLGISQFSTLYVTYEPLFLNPTKNSYIGKVRGISFGAACDFYSTATGTGILPHTYTFESLQVSQAVVVADGWGGCISIVAADIR
ncbi:hypothetical protein MUP79_06665, partial [Candidatus Bathyarchaeota archaeon]|nr:hypothetical protein [Candidatus Bathyarchaeota archaeon]